MNRMISDAKLVTLMQTAVSETQVYLHHNGPEAHPRRSVHVHGVDMRIIADEVAMLVAQKLELLAALELATNALEQTADRLSPVTMSARTVLSRIKGASQ